MKKEEFQILAVKHANGKIVCQTEFDQQRLNTLALNTPLKITVIKDPRNYRHHKKFFKLLSEAFVYWQPEFKVLTDSEEWLIGDYHKQVTEYTQKNLSEDAAKAFNEMLEYFKQNSMDKLKTRRENKLDYEGMKTMEGFRDYVMKKAGCYDIKPSSDGGTLKERWSIAFDKMPQAQFNDVYKRCFGVIWNEILSDVFAKPEQVEERINMLLSFE